MRFTVIPKVLGVRIVYSVDVIKAASRLKMALRKLTDNDRNLLLIQMGDAGVDCSDVTIYLIEATKDVRIEDLRDKPNKVKLFVADSTDQETLTDIGKYILASYGII